MSLKKKNYNNEIDLIDFFLIISNYKWRVLISIALAVISMLIFITNQPSIRLSYFATTEIKPISTFEEFEYESYNSYLKSTDYDNVFYSFNPFKEDMEKIDQKHFVFKDIDFYKGIDNSSFNKIDKAFLFDLFIDKLNENSTFINAVKKFNLIKREDYQSNEAYENAIMKLSSSIQLNSELNKNSKLKEGDNLFNFNIEFKTQDKELWEKILKYIEYSANKEIQEYLNETFNRLISDQKRLKKYKIEDIDILMSNTEAATTSSYISNLQTLRNDISKNKNIERLQDEFSSTPIVRSKDFYAARLMVKSTSYKSSSNKKYRKIPMLILAGLIGAIIGIFYVLMLNSIKNRNKY